MRGWKTFDREAAARLGVLAVVAVAVLLVDPRGDFPLDDDWDFAYTSVIFARTGTFQATPFISSTVYLQSIWGAVWTTLFGQSFTVLRLSTIALAVLTALLVFHILRRAGVSLPLTMFGTIAFFAHPLHFWSTFTFMTHMPTLFLGVLSLALFLRAIETSSMRWLAIAVVVATIGMLNRQIAIVNVLAPLATAFLARRELGAARSRKLAIAYAAGLAVLGVLFLTTPIFSPSKETVIHAPRLAMNWDTLAMTLAVSPAHYAFFNVQNAALFFAPLLLLVAAIPEKNTFRRPAFLVTTTIFVACAANMIRLGKPIPYFNYGNVFANLGLGPHTLRDTFTFRMPYPHHLSMPARLTLMIVSTALAIVAAMIVIRFLRSGSVLMRYCAVYCVIGTAIHAGMRLYFDRYSIDTMWPLGLLLVLLASQAGVPRAARAVAVAALVVTLLFSIVYTAEYLAWNRARWAAYRALRARGVQLEQMDGGYEINAQLAIRTGTKQLRKPGVAVVDDEYILAFNQVPGYSAIGRFPYPRLLGLREGNVYVLRRR